MDALYLIELQFSPQVGRGFVCEREWTRQNVIDQVASGEWGRGVKVIKVLEIREDENRVSDVTEEIAKAIADQFYADREPVSYELQNFIQAHCGVTATHDLNVAA